MTPCTVGTVLLQVLAKWTKSAVFPIKSETKIILRNCNQILCDQLGDSLKESGRNDSEVFITFVKAKPVLKSKSDELISAGRQANVKQYVFKKCVELETMLQTTKSFGTYEGELEEIQTSQSTGRPEVQTTNVNQHTEATGYYISMSP